MRDAFAKGGVFGGFFIKVHVEIVARDATEVHHIRFGHGASVGQQGVANLQFFKITSERVQGGVVHFGTTHEFAGDGGQHAG